MISKIIIVAIATGIGLASYIPKGIDEAMNNHQRISEHQEYKKHTDTVKIEEKIEDMAEADKASEIAYLEELEAQLEGMNAIEIQQYLEEQGIPYELEELNFYSTWDKDRNPYIYYHWKISVVEGNHEFYADWYDKQGNVEIFTMGVQEVDN